MGKTMLGMGASSGMGREAAILLAREGHTVYAGARRADRMDGLTEHGIAPVEMDVSKGGDNKRAIGRIIDTEGRIDVLINNAGFGLYGTVEDIATATVMGSISTSSIRVAGAGTTESQSGLAERDSGYAVRTGLQEVE